MMSWDWFKLSKTIRMDIVWKYPEKSWDFHSMSQNPNLTISIVEKYKSKNWDKKKIAVQLAPNIKKRKRANILLLFINRHITIEIYKNIICLVTSYLF